MGGLGREAVALAKQELRRRRWRGGGVLPRGYDAEGIAWEVIERVIEGRSRIAAGWTRAPLLKEIERLISGKVRLLCSLKETRAVRYEWDILPRKANGEAVSILPGVAGDGRNGYEAALEAEEGRGAFRKRITAELEDETELQVIFGCLWEGERRTREIARRLGMDEQAVALARRRLGRRLKALRLSREVENLKEGEAAGRREEHPDFSAKHHEGLAGGKGGARPAHDASQGLPCQRAGEQIGRPGDRGVENDAPVDHTRRTSQTGGLMQ